MHSRRIGSFLLGLWVGGGLLVGWFAANSFRSMDQAMLQASRLNPVDSKKLAPPSKILLDRMVVEQNASLFKSWETAQIVFGLLLFLYFLFGTRLRKFPMAAVLTMVAIVAVQRLFVTPELVSMARFADLSTISPTSGLSRKFELVHWAYIGLDALKFGIALAIAVRFALSHGRRDSDDPRKEINFVDKSDHRHIDW